MFYIETLKLACATNDARICEYRDVFLVRDLDTDKVIDATWDPQDADATAALLNADDAHVLATV